MLTLLWAHNANRRVGRLQSSVTMGTLATIGDLLHLVQQSGTWILPDHLPSCCPDPISDIAYQQLDKGIVSAAVC